MFSPRKAQSFVKSEIVKTGAGDREEGGLVKEKVKGRAYRGGENSSA
jgi:hypothetical protein